MQLLRVDSNITFSQLRDIVGNRHISEFLAVNGLERRPDIGKQITTKFTNAISTENEVDWQRKSTILNRLSTDNDLFETAALCGSSAWKALSSVGTFPGTLKVPETIKLPDSVSVIGNGISTPKLTYDKVMSQLTHPPYEIDPSVFNEFSSRVGMSSVTPTTHTQTSNFFQMFNIPWGDITLYSSFGDTVDFPVYPETVEDGVSAEYSQMPDLIYQYEPWFVYQNSGPRSCTYDFHMHRDMWTGDHADGKCNELIRICESQCYARYQGSSVQTPLVSLYISGKSLITGIMTSAKVSWGGPILNDGWYGEVTLSISIVEVSQSALNYDTVKSKGLIG